MTQYAAVVLIVTVPVELQCKFGCMDMISDSRKRREWRK